MLVIGKSAKPNCFQNFNVDPLGANKNSKIGWMNFVLLLNFLNELNSEIKRVKRRIILIMDNAASHATDVEFSNVTISFLPIPLATYNL